MQIREIKATLNLTYKQRKNMILQSQLSLA